MNNKNPYQATIGHFHDKTGLRYGMLTILERDYKAEKKSGGKGVRWKARCDCGSVKTYLSANIISNNNINCGCVRNAKTIERNTSHGKTNTREYRIWSAIKRRCYNAKHPTYLNYGGRGIGMCKRWKESFKAFLEDMGPSNGLTIDRRDNDKDYSPENCRWATRAEQGKNKRNNLKINYKGKILGTSELAAELETTPNVVRARLQTEVTSSIDPEYDKDILVKDIDKSMFYIFDSVKTACHVFKCNVLDIPNKFKVRPFNKEGVKDLWRKKI